MDSNMPEVQQTEIDRDVHDSPSYSPSDSLAQISSRVSIVSTPGEPERKKKRSNTYSHL